MIRNLLIVAAIGYALISLAVPALQAWDMGSSIDTVGQSQLEQLAEGR